MSSSRYSTGSITDDELSATGDVFIVTVTIVTGAGEKDLWLGEIHRPDFVAEPAAFDGRLMTMKLDRLPNWNGQVRVYLEPGSADDGRSVLRFVGLGQAPPDLPSN